MTSLKISFVSLGCDKNLVDSEVMIGLIEREGYILATEKMSDIIIINTCGFLMDATQEAIDHILRLAAYKKSGSCKALIVTGCMAQRYKKEIFKQLPEVDAVVGTTAFDSIGQVIKDVMLGKKATYIEKPSVPIAEDLFLLRKPTNKHIAYLKISEGCDRHCTYCTIPSIRGKYRSRTIESLIKEAQTLAQSGTKELIIVAQDTTCYGIDIYKAASLHTLLNELVKIDTIEWIRILYAYPENITPQILQTIATQPKVLPYLDMPIQHSHSAVLKAMGRNMTGTQLRQIITNIKSAVPDITLRTTIMVGFPGEKQEYFADLKNFVKEAHFDKLGVFTYSREEGTPAAKMNNQVPQALKQKRKDTIMAIQEQISKKKLQKKIGKTTQAIIDQKTANNYKARTQADCYDIDGNVTFTTTQPVSVGDIVTLKITHTLEHDLIGELVC